MLECLSKIFSEHVPDVASTSAEIHQFFMRNKGGPGMASMYNELQSLLAMGLRQALI